MEYFKAALRKDSKWFDAHNPNELSTKIGKECLLIQRGIGEKIGDLYGTCFLFVLGYFCAFFIGWEFTLILLGAIPVVMVAGIIMAKAGKAGVQEQLIAYQQCAGIAEQSLQAIKVVHTYGREELESTNYNKYLNRTLD